MSKNDCFESGKCYQAVSTTAIRQEMILRPTQEYSHKFLANTKQHFKANKYSVLLPKLEERQLAFIGVGPSLAKLNVHSSITETCEGKLINEDMRHEPNQKYQEAESML